jgi:trypsin
MKTRARRRMLIAAIGVAVAAAGVAAGQPPATGSTPLRKVVDAFEQGVAQDQRIVGGRKTTLAEHPWQVALLAAKVPTNTLAQFCGGSAIGDRWVLTAAHCVDGATLPEDVDVLTGTDSLVTGGRRVRADQIAVHDNWNPATHDFDVAIVHMVADLGRQAIAGLKVTDADPAVGQMITVTGWGALAWQDAKGSKDLLLATVPYVTRDTCNQRGSYAGRITDNMLCAGTDLGGPDACQGDSGGPATTTVAGLGTRLVGVVSWGDGCGFPKKFGIYTRVSQIADWVAEKTGNAVRW